jgi:hypothetical protein
LKDLHDTQTLELFPIELALARHNEVDEWEQTQLRKWREAQAVRAILGETFDHE